MLKLLKDPLVHFLLLGGLIFLLFAWRGESDDTGHYQIVISDEDVQSMWQTLTILHGQAPTREELWNMLEPNIKEEVLYREALALGLERDDRQVRARLAEKMLFLTQDLAEPTAPTETELMAFLQAYPERFRQQATISFEQIFFSPSGRGAPTEAGAEAALRQLREDNTKLVPIDDLLLEDRYERAEFGAIGRAFGTEFAAAMFGLQSNNIWQGPLRSTFGLHFVRVSELTEAIEPDLDEIRAEITTTLTAQRRVEANEAGYRKLRDRYDIVINLPEFAQPVEPAE